MSDPLVTSLKKTVGYGVKILAILMTLVIFWAIGDVIFVLYQLVVAEPFLRLGNEHLLTIFASFLTVLIAIEIFINIVIYLNKSMFHVDLVVATALTAVARKVIVLDYSNARPELIYGLAAVILAVGIAYWLTNHTGRGTTKV